MIAIPALDLRDGACVQLEGGDYTAEKVRITDPLQVARDSARAGFRRLHVVDLDAATGHGSNTALVTTILAELGGGVAQPATGAGRLAIQVGGGVRDTAAIEALLNAGAASVIVGTRAIEDPAWLAAAAARFPDRLVVAADVRGRAVVTRGWMREAGPDVGDVLDALAALPLAGVLVTAVHVEGRLAGPDLALMEALSSRSRLPLQASGGIATLDHLRSLARLGVEAAIVGMALYTGALEPRALTQEFATCP